MLKSLEGRKFSFCWKSARKPGKGFEAGRPGKEARDGPLILPFPPPPGRLRGTPGVQKPGTWPGLLLWALVRRSQDPRCVHAGVCLCQLDMGCGSKAQMALSPVPCPEPPGSCGSRLDRNSAGRTKEAVKDSNSSCPEIPRRGQGIRGPPDSREPGVCGVEGGVGEGIRSKRKGSKRPNKMLTERPDTTVHLQGLSKTKGLALPLPP